MGVVRFYNRKQCPPDDYIKKKIKKIKMNSETEQTLTRGIVYFAFATAEHGGRGRGRGRGGAIPARRKLLAKTDMANNEPTRPGPARPAHTFPLFLPLSVQQTDVHMQHRIY